MIQTIILFIAVLIFIYGIMSTIMNVLKFATNTKLYGNLVIETILITIGLTYILWYCN